MFLNRHDVCRMLSLSIPASYRYGHLRPRRLGMISSADVIAMLNNAAEAGQPLVDGEVIPEVLTAEEVSRRTGVPAHSLVLATRRRIDRIPHWRLNSHEVRFSVDSVTRWMEGR